MNITLSLVDYAALSPLLILLGGALFVLLLEALSESLSRKFSATITLYIIAGAIYATFVSPDSQNTLLTPWLRFDNLTRFFNLLFLFIGFASTLLSVPFFKIVKATHGEFFFLLISSLFGLLLIGASADFLTLFLGLETLSISLYVLCGYIKIWKNAHESAMKYFLLGSISAAFFLYGVAFIYGAIGTTNLNLLLEGYQHLANGADQTLFFTGIAFLTLGLAFKAAIVPFQAWAPDVYYGAPNPVTAFMAVGTKAGAFAAFIRIFIDAIPQFDPLWNVGISILAYPTLIYANIVAIRQVQLRRFFAYSGISHAGFLLIPLAVGTPEALNALLFYLVVYALGTLGSFAVLAYMDKESHGVLLHDLNGLFRRSPYLAGIFSICLLTLAGIPPTVGFFAKFFVFKVAFQAGFIGLVIVGLLMTIFSAYYYLRIIALMLSKEPTEHAAPQPSWSAATVGFISLAAIITFSCYPDLLFKLINLT
jgi:NADH-quinone oxidoreductase subunit N